jgi:hypothetical protein
MSPALLIAPPRRRQSASVTSPKLAVWYATAHYPNRDFLHFFHALGFTGFYLHSG